MTTNVQDIDTAFADEKEIWVLEYGATHGVMRLAVHAGTYPRYTEVVCGGCTFFAGKLLGGPYRVVLEHCDVEPKLRIVGDGFRLECSQARVERVRT